MPKIDETRPFIAVRSRAGGIRPASLEDYRSCAALAERSASPPRLADRAIVKDEVPTGPRSGLSADPCSTRHHTGGTGSGALDVTPRSVQPRSKGD